MSASGVSSPDEKISILTTALHSVAGADRSTLALTTWHTATTFGCCGSYGALHGRFRLRLVRKRQDRQSTSHCLTQHSLEVAVEH